MKYMFAMILFLAVLSVTSAQEVPLEQKYSKIIQKMDCGVYVSAIEDLKKEIEKLEKPGGNNAELALLYRLCGNAHALLEDRKNAGLYYSKFINCLENSTEPISPDDIYTMFYVTRYFDPANAGKICFRANQLAQKFCKEEISNIIMQLVRPQVQHGDFSEDDYGKAFQISSEYTKKIEKEKGDSSIEYAESLLIMSFLKNKAGFYDEAVSLAEKGLEIYRAKNGKFAQAHLIHLSILFLLYNGTCANYDKAMATLDEIISVARTNGGLDLRAQSLSEIQTDQREIISFAISHKKEDKVREIAELLVDDSKMEYNIYSLVPLDNECRRFGLKTPEKATEKIQHYKNILGEKLREVRQKNGINSLETYKVYRDFSDFYNLSEDSTAAVQCLQDAYNIKKNIFGEDSPEILSDLLNQYYSSTPEDYLKHIDDAIEITKKHFGTEHPLYAICIARKVTEVSESEKETLLLKALEISQKYYGKDSPETVDQLQSLLFYYAYREIPPAGEKIIMSLEKTVDKLPWNTKLSKAIDSIKKSLPPSTFETEKFDDTLAKILALYKKNFGTDNVQQISFLIESIRFKEKIGASPDKLKEIVSEIIRIYKKVGGKDNPFVALYYLQLKDKLESTDAVRDDLESALSEGLEISKKNFGGKDLLTAKCLVELSDLFLKSGKNLNKAEEYLNRALAVYEKLDFLTTEHEECLQELMQLYIRDTEKHAKYENLLKELRKKYKWENE